LKFSIVIFIIITIIIIIIIIIIEISVLSRDNFVRQAALSNSSRLGYLQIFSFLKKLFIPANTACRIREAKGIYLPDFETVVNINCALINPKDKQQHSIVSIDASCGDSKNVHTKVLKLQRQVYFSLSDLNSIDLTETIAETLLSILEHPPFNLIEVDTKFKNSVSGRLRFKPIFLTTGDANRSSLIDFNVSSLRKVNSRGQRLLQAMLDLSSCKKKMDLSNSKIDLARTAQPESKVHSKSWFYQKSLLNSSDDDDDEEELSGSDSEKESLDPNKFDIFLSDLISLLTLSKEEITLELYILQKNGFIEYNLSKPTLSIILKHSLNTFDINIDTAESLEDPDLVVHFCKEVTSKLLHSINVIESSSKKRLYDMWQIGSVVENFTSNYGGNDNKSESQSSERKESIQHLIRKMLCSFMDYNEKTATSKKFDLGEECSMINISNPHSLVHLPLYLKKLEGNNLFYPEEQKEINSLNFYPWDQKARQDIESVQKDISILNQDINLISVIKNISLDAKLLNKNQKEYKNYILQLKTIYFTKIFHGLGTSFISISEWKDHVTWGRYQHFDFIFLANLCYSLLKLKDGQSN